MAYTAITETMSGERLRLLDFSRLTSDTCVMVKISILYPRTVGSTFDMDYYLRTHMPMSLARLKTHPGFISLSVERGVETPQSGTPPAYVAICHYTFSTAEDFVAAFMPHAEALQADIANYTTIAPVVQFSVVEIAEPVEQ